MFVVDRLHGSHSSYLKRYAFVAAVGGRGREYPRRNAFHRPLWEDTHATVHARAHTQVAKHVQLCEFEIYKGDHIDSKKQQRSREWMELLLQHVEFLTEKRSVRPEIDQLHQQEGADASKFTGRIHMILQQ